MRVGGRRSPSVHQLAQNSILHPLSAPPIDRRNGIPREQHSEVQVITAGKARGAAATELRVEVDQSRKVMMTEDAREGPLAFAEKRAPVWKGR